MLSDKDILDLITKKELKIEPFDEKNIGCASIDLALDKNFVRYSEMIDTHNDEISYENLVSEEMILQPEEFILGVTKEKIRIPDGYYGFIETKGNFARAGISVTCDDGHIDPGTDGKITIEIKNHNNIPVKIYHDDLICQLFLFRLSSRSRVLYGGKYQNQTGPTIYKR